MLKPIDKQHLWSDGLGNEFELLRVWNPNEEQDPWAEYKNTATQQVYTARLEAFRARFNPLPN